MNQTIIRCLIAFVIVSVFSTTGIFAVVNDHEHEHKNHHPEEQNKQKEDDHDNHNDHKKHEGHNEHAEEELQIHLDDKVRQEFGIKIETAKSGRIKKTKLFPGEVSIHLDYLAHITPRFPGVVKKIYRHIGDDVKKGDVLAVIESNDSLTPYKITSPITGTIIEKHLTLGESVEENSHAFEVANLNTVWVTFSIFQDKFGDISKGQHAIIRSSNGKHKTQGTISYIAPTVEEHTRTQMGRIVLPNKKHHWKPGMFVDVNVVFASIKSDIVVPKSAIQKIDNKPVIFIKEGDEFEAHPVQLGDADINSVIVLSGLKPGTPYVSEGGFILKAELEKGSMGDGHAH